MLVRATLGPEYFLDVGWSQLAAPTGWDVWGYFGHLTLGTSRRDLAGLQQILFVLDYVYTLHRLSGYLNVYPFH
jgi:hypothetical protein